MKLVIPLLTALALLAFMACGPAADAGEGEKEDAPAATATPKPDTEPTKTPAPEAGPTKTPVPMPTDKPTPTPFPDDVGSATPTVEPTFPPPPQPTRRPRDTPHPEGLAGCADLTWFVIDTQEEESMRKWCERAIDKDVHANCYFPDDVTEDLTAKEQECGRQRASQGAPPLHRGRISCLPISDNEDYLTCFNEAVARISTVHEQGPEILSAILQEVDEDTEVKALKIEIGNCMVENGYDRPAGSGKLPWQAMKDEEREKIDRTIADRSRDEVVVKIDRWDVLDQCAASAGLYEVQHTLFVAQLNRLTVGDPDKASILGEWGIKPLLEEDGPAPFLRAPMHLLNELR